MEAKIFVCAIFCLVQFGSSCSPLPTCEPPSQSSQSLRSVKSMLLTADNIRYFATHFTPTASINGSVIDIGAGAADELLIEVPLGVVDQRATIVVTVGVDKTHFNTPGTDADLHVGISDGTSSNLQWIVDVNNYVNFPPCYPDTGSLGDERVSRGTNVPSTFKLSFVPFYKYGACETAQEGGYIGTGTFATQIDTSKPLFLRLLRNNAPEQYYIYYVNVDIY